MYVWCIMFSEGSDNVYTMFCNVYVIYDVPLVFDCVCVSTILTELLFISMKPCCCNTVTCDVILFIAQCFGRCLLIHVAVWTVQLKLLRFTSRFFFILLLCLVAGSNSDSESVLPSALMSYLGNMFAIPPTYQWSNVFILWCKHYMRVCKGKVMFTRCVQTLTNTCVVYGWWLCG